MTIPTAPNLDMPIIPLGDAVLRPLRPSDTEDLLGYLGDPAVTELTSFPEVTRTLAEAMIERARSRWAAGEPSRWAVARVADDRIIGTCGFSDGSPVHRWAELAYDLARPEWGKGVMPRAVAAALAWAFRGGHVDRVQAHVRVDNVRSRRVLVRSGFMLEGCLRSYRICRGTPYDFEVHALLRREWESARRSDGVEA